MLDVICPESEIPGAEADNADYIIVAKSTNSGTVVNRVVELVRVRSIFSEYHKNLQSPKQTSADGDELDGSGVRPV